MGISNKILGKNDEPTLLQDIYSSSEWIANALSVSGYKADYSLDSMREIDRFYDEQNTPTGILSKNRGQFLFALGSYIGQTVIKLYGGKWITNDNDPEGEMNIAVNLDNGSTIWPVMKCMKRYTNGQEDSIYDYVYVLDKHTP